MNLCDRCGNYPDICGCADMDILSAKLSRHEHWIADLTREAEALLSFINGKTKDHGYQKATQETSSNCSLHLLPHMERRSLSSIYPVRDEESLAKVAASLRSIARREEDVHGIEPTTEIRIPMYQLLWLVHGQRS